MTYLFAFSDYCGGPRPKFYGVRQDLTIFSSDNWDAFWAETRQYCSHDLQLFCHGESKSHPDQEVYTHEYFNQRFIIVGDYEAIKPIPDSDMEWWQGGDDDGGEGRYWRGVQCHLERFSY